MNHDKGYTVTVITTERTTVTRTIKREIRIAPADGHKKSTRTAATVNVLVAVGKDAGNHKA